LSSAHTRVSGRGGGFTVQHDEHTHGHAPLLGTSSWLAQRNASECRQRARRIITGTLAVSLLQQWQDLAGHIWRVQGVKTDRHGLVAGALCLPRRPFAHSPTEVVLCMPKGCDGLPNSMGNAFPVTNVLREILHCYSGLLHTYAFVSLPVNRVPPNPVSSCYCRMRDRIAAIGATDSCLCVAPGRFNETHCASE